MCILSPDEKLEILHNTQDRRLKEKTNYKHCMQDKCNLIPDSLSWENRVAPGMKTAFYDKP